MTAGFLDRIVESGTTSLRDVRGSIGGRTASRDHDEQIATEGTSFAREELQPAVDPASQRPHMDASPDRLGIPSADRQPEIGLDAGAATFHQSAGPRREALAVPMPVPGPVSQRAEPRADAGGPDEATRPQSAGKRAAGSPAPLLKDAGIRSVSSNAAQDFRQMPSLDDVRSPSRADRQSPAAFAAAAEPLDRLAEAGADGPRPASPRGHNSAEHVERARPQAAVPLARLEEWQRLKERLLLEHHPGSSKRDLPAGNTEQNATSSPERGNADTAREIVIDQLEVVVAAPYPVASEAPRRPAPPTRSGAWSVAARHYLGKL